MATGKNREQFEKWYLDYITKKEYSNAYAQMQIDLFNGHIFEFQIGVYLAYYDSLNLKITITHDTYSRWHCFINSGIIEKNVKKCTQEHGMDVVGHQIIMILLIGCHYLNHLKNNNNK